MKAPLAVFDGEKVTVYAFDREPRVISTEEMLAASKFCPEFTLDTVYSRSAEKARAFAEKWGAPHWTDSLEALAASESVDAVYIASPNALHCEQTLLMLRGGKHVLCEKPIAAVPWSWRPCSPRRRSGAWCCSRPCARPSCQPSPC